MTDPHLSHQDVDPVVRVRFWAGARAAAGVEEVTVAAGRVRDVTAAVARSVPGVVAILPLCSLLVDGRRVSLDDEALPGSVVEVLPPFAGG